jgi:fatty acid-binding protein DegV
VSFRDKTFDINELPKICDKYYETIINNIDWTKIKRIAYLEGTNNDKFKTEQIKEKMLNYYEKKITSKLKIETGKLPAAISVHTGPHYFAFVIEGY